jgi:Cu+-exporting ATPase
MMLIVNTAGVALIIVILWYFFLSRKGEAGEARGERDLQRISVRVKGGYIPEIVMAKPDLPLEIAFVREEDSPCSEEIVFPTLGIQRMLPAFQTTTVRIPPSPEGRYPFSCGMNMLHGVLVVGGAGASPDPAEAPEAEGPVDPVCGMRVARSPVSLTSVRDRRTVYFCGPACKQRYDGESASSKTTT